MSRLSYGLIRAPAARVEEKKAHLVQLLNLLGTGNAGIGSGSRDGSKLRAHHRAGHGGSGESRDTAVGGVCHSSKRGWGGVAQKGANAGKSQKRGNLHLEVVLWCVENKEMRVLNG